MWNVEVPIFEDEDEEALIGEFVRLSALYPNYEPYQIARQVFKGLREPELRSAQAAKQWSDDLDIKDRIDKRIANGGAEDAEIDSKKDKLKILEGIYKNPLTAAKEKIAAIQLHAQIQGEIIKAVEKKTTDLTPRFPQIVGAVYTDDN